MECIYATMVYNTKWGNVYDTKWNNWHETPFYQV